MTYEWLAILILTVSWVMLYVAYCRLLDYVYEVRDHLDTIFETLKRADAKITEHHNLFVAQIRWTEDINSFTAHQNKVNAAIGVVNEFTSNQMAGYCERIGALEKQQCLKCEAEAVREEASRKILDEMTPEETAKYYEGFDTGSPIGWGKR